MVRRFFIAWPNFRVAESGSVREHASPDSHRIGSGLRRGEFGALVQPRRASARRWVGDFRAGFFTVGFGSASVNLAAG